MNENPSLEDLAKKLGELSERQRLLQRDLQEVRDLLSGKFTAKLESPPITEEPTPLTKKDEPLPPILKWPDGPKAPETFQKELRVNTPITQTAKIKKEKTPLEEFIGTNLLNKIGIAVLVIGVGIGAEYAIDHDLISPLTRIILGYLCGIGLIGIAIRLKAKYANFSAVLLSGGMAVMYFITFAAYDLYALMPQVMAFILMVIFTAFTVFASLQYNLQVIAIIGLVGAYAVPFLLSNGSGQVIVLFSYMTIVNVGILVLGFKKYWRLLYYLAFVFTWLIFGAWCLDRYRVEEHLTTELIFSTIFFGIFYATVLAYKLIRGESLTKKDVSLVLLNSFIYYALGYFAIDAHQHGEAYLGLFTVFNAMLHFVVCVVIYRNQAQTRDIFLFAAGMVLVFLTLAIPVQLEGNWVTMIWAAEAAMLFWLGRTKNYPGYEKLSYPLIILAIGSLYHDWSRYYVSYDGYHITPFLNIQLLTSLIVCAAVGVVVKFSHDPKYPSPLAQGRMGNELLTKGLPALLGLTLFAAFYYEVDNYWQQRFYDSYLGVREYYSGSQIADNDVLKFKTIWLLNYTAIFVLALGALNWFKLKNEVVSYVVMALAAVSTFMLITVGLVTAAELRTSYLNQTNATYYYRDAGHLLIRYVCIALTLALLFLNYKIGKLQFVDPVVRIIERLFFHFVILSILSSELVSGLALAGLHDSDKLALSILWGAYALGLIVFGLMKDLKYIRIAAIVLFGVTLVKLFFYDMAGMGTISKTIVMIILGALLLVASFLYNKFKKTPDEKI